MPREFKGEPNALRRLRIERGLTQKELADKAAEMYGKPITPGHIQKLESGERKVDSSGFLLGLSIAKALGVEPEKLLENQ